MANATTIEGDMTTGGQGVGFWLPLLDAAATYGVSERTMRRRVSDGEVPNRLRHGRREVMVPLAPQTATTRPDEDGIPTGDKVAGSAAGALAGIEGGVAGVLALLADELRSGRRLAVDEAQNELRRVRRSAGTAWVLVGILTTLGAGGGVLGFLSVRQADEQAASIEQALTAAQTRQDELAGVVGALEAQTRSEAARTATMADELHAARLRVLEAEVARVRAEAEADRLGGTAPGVLLISG